MAKLSRVLQKIFGSSGGGSEFGQIGSLAAGSPSYSKDLDTIQSLTQFLEGLFAITNSGAQPPRIQDINSLYLLFSSQLKYLFQAGIPEWIATEEYYIGSICQVAGVLYTSKTGTSGSPNVGNAVTDMTNWKTTLNTSDLSGLANYWVSALASNANSSVRSNDAATALLCGIGGGIANVTDINTLSGDGIIFRTSNSATGLPVAAFAVGIQIYINNDWTCKMQILMILNSGVIYSRAMYAGTWESWSTGWGSENYAAPGSGHGLDADKLDGQHASAFATAAQGTKADAALPASGLGTGWAAALAADLKNVQLPIGSMIAFDGAWTDNVTMPGWYACIAANSGLGCPNMVDRFILGKAIAGSGATGGSNTHTIAAAELPVHTHDLGSHTHSTPNHAHSLSNHTHTVALGTHTHYVGGAGPAGAPYYIGLSGAVGLVGPGTFIVGAADLGTPGSSGPSVNATDTSGAGTTGAASGNTGNGGFANSAIDMHPAYYSMVYVKRVS